MSSAQQSTPMTDAEIVAAYRAGLLQTSEQMSVNKTEGKTTSNQRKKKRSKVQKTHAKQEYEKPSTAIEIIGELREPAVPASSPFGQGVPQQFSSKKSDEAGCSCDTIQGRFPVGSTASAESNARDKVLGEAISVVGVSPMQGEPQPEPWCP